jgi:hypothetical protein
VLVSYEPFADSIEDKFLAVVAGVKAFENFLINSHGWEMLNIWVMINRVANYMVDVVRSFPPPDANTTDQISNDYSKNTIRPSDMCDSVVP